MFKALICFYLKQLAAAVLPYWYQGDDLTAKERRPIAHRRRQSKVYRKKLKLVRSLWTGMGMIMLIFPYLPVIAVSAMFATCLSFAILDET